MKGFRLLIPGLLTLVTMFCPAKAAEELFEIQVLDSETGRGIPLVELTTVSWEKYVTDNHGRVAYRDPGTMGQNVFFNVKAHGYLVPKDGFSISGARFDVTPGGRGELKLKRVNVAERLYRLTGQALYRDSVLLKKEVPLKNPLSSGLVAGQDSAFAVPYRNKIYWFWGDTNRMAYPLGMFRTAGAASPLPGPGVLPVEKGVDFDYFVGKDGFARAMVDVENPEGVVWIFGICTVPDAAGKEHMVGHFSRRKGLGEEYQHGIVLYNDEREIFEVKTSLPLTERWRHLTGQPVKVKKDGVDYIYCGVPTMNIRVPATLEAVLDPTQYEALSVNEEALKAKDGERPVWRWTKEHAPTTVKQEAHWVRQGALKAQDAKFVPEDAGKLGRRVMFHTGSVKWNEHRQKWVFIAMEEAYWDKDSPSPLGEVWYSEADAVDGPFKKAVRIVTHDKQTFYNPVHHSFLDQENGRVIYFEGTYTNQFVDSPPTPLYDYNQIMYRLDLDSPSLKAAFPR